MPWGAVAGAVISAGAGAASSASASRSQRNAADAATAEQRRQYDTTRSDNQTALDARNNSLARMQELAGTFGSGPTAEQVMATPGYQFGLTQGQNGLNNNAAATGGLYSGAQLRAASRYNTDYATTKYDNALNNLRNSQSDQFNRYASISGQGQLGANAINSAGQNMANNNSATYQNLGNAQGAASIAQGNAIANGANQAASWWSNRQQSPSSGGNFYGGNSSSGAQIGAGQDYNYGGMQSGWADGGPVRAEPKVGTKAPPKSGGGGGGMSSNAIMEMMQKPASSATNSLAMLAANPVTKPAAITAERMKAEGEWASGGAVHGPGGPKDDLIPARLSDGEHVMDEASVTALGEGSNEAGQVKLNKLRAMLKGGHDITGQRLESLPPKVRELYAAWGKN